MPTSAEQFAADTSVAVAAVDGGHAAHELCRRRVRETSAALAGHAAVETYAVLTRMPGPLRLDAAAAAALLETAFPERCWLDGEQTAELLRRCGPLGVVGGAVYDALVGEAARCAGRVLLTRDRRAQRTYDMLGTSYELLV